MACRVLIETRNIEVRDCVTGLVKSLVCLLDKRVICGQARVLFCRQFGKRCIDLTARMESAGKVLFFRSGISGNDAKSKRCEDDNRCEVRHEKNPYYCVPV